MSEWKIYAKRADFNAIGERFGIDPVIARIIRNRDIEDDENINKYLNGNLDMTYSPFLMADMEKGCMLMADKIKQGKKIRIVSDYDVDGIMSNYILLDGLKAAGADVTYEIPDRQNDGYGINERIVNDAAKDGVDTIITCDNGIAAFAEADLAKKLGMTVIVTDHHEVPYDIDDNGERIYKYVNADAVIDIKRPDCAYPFKELCGTGVAYKFIRALYEKLGLSWDNELKYIEMVAIATVCDMMDLTDENRIYVKKGLEILKQTTNTGLKALLEATGISGKKITSYHAGFIIGPCLNATGRLESAKEGLGLLLCDDKVHAAEMAARMKELNDERKKMTDEGRKAGIAQVEEKLSDDTVLVVYLPNLHESIAGLVASKLKEKYYKPVFVCTDIHDDPDMIKGSCRSIEGYDIHNALVEIKDIMTKFGGHKMAAGFSLPKENLREMRRRLNDNQRLTDKELNPDYMIDVPVPVSYLNIPFVEQLSVLEPTGKGNKKPVFAQSGLGIKRAIVFGKESQYIRIFFQDNDANVICAVDFDGITFQSNIKMWFSDEECDKILNGSPNNVKLDVAYYPEINDYNGRKSIQLKLLLYRKHED